MAFHVSIGIGSTLVSAVKNFLTKAIPAKVRSGFAFGIAQNKELERFHASIRTGNAPEQFQQKCEAVLRPQLRKNKELSVSTPQSKPETLQAEFTM